MPSRQGGPGRGRVRGVGSAVLLALCWAGSGLAAEFDCIIEPSKSVDVRAASEGLIEKIWVDRGDTVKKDQVLVTLDSGVERAAAESARYRATMQGKIRTGQSRVEFSTTKYKRREQLASQSFISLSDRDEALTEKRLAESELLEAKDERRLSEIEYQRLSEQLRLRTIRSPVNGIVVDRLLNAGELADNRDLRKPILKLADIGTLHVEVLMPIEAFGKLSIGEKVEVLPEAPVGGRHTATVAVIDRVLDAASGTFGVRLELPNPTLKLPAGIKCRASFPAIAGRSAPPAASAARPPAKPAPAVSGKPM
ncbi:efflux RND transporter periplasmic adaptor subunit [Candidatus Accumulibacter sp. ACC003]|uniref:efflux RND transporter periplasmic adaptor subunit n=1 Tax=Candidatus Accumulibacter sp. ACC003 TaxID=2823334 RepID=UPI0025BDBD22|nr:efflux RND transporter periplasmic adaptor subunit [Candidatus Accumulibacter sp. ACC003]